MKTVLRNHCRLGVIGTGDVALWCKATSTTATAADSRCRVTNGTKWSSAFKLSIDIAGPLHLSPAEEAIEDWLIWGMEDD